MGGSAWATAFGSEGRRMAPSMRAACFSPWRVRFLSIRSLMRIIPFPASQPLTPSETSAHEP